MLKREPSSSKKILHQHRANGSSDDRPAVKKPEINLQIVLDAVVDYAIFMLDKNGVVSTWNRGAERLKGYTARDIIGKHFSIFYTAEDLAAGKPKRELKIAARTGRYEEEGWRLRKDGSRFWANVVLTPIYDSSHHLRGFSKVTRNFDERRRIMEDLRHSEERFRLLVQAVKDYAIFMLLPDGTIASWNEGAERAKGYTASEIIGKNFSVFYTPEDLATGKPKEMLRIAALRGRVEDEGWRVRKDGTRFLADVVLTAIRDAEGRLQGFSKVTRDVTERKLAEQTIVEKQRQIVELQKLEAVGRLAGGIAHDFNNLLAGIRGCTEALAEMVASLPEAAAEVQEIEKAGEHARTLCRQLLTFSRRQIASPVVVQINHQIEELEKMLARLLGAGIRLDLYLTKGLPPLKMDPSQLQQIIVNLVVNAGDAMPAGGTLSLRTGVMRLDELSTAENFIAAPGDYIMLSIADTGTGMSPEVRQHIFEPFFTTKPMGLGTGLGLATVYGVVQQNHGTISVESAPGLGSTFKIFLPVHSEGSGTKRRAQAVRESGDSLCGTETILVAEDDPLVLRHTVSSLQKRGYTVLSAVNGEEASALVDKMKNKLDLVVTDVIMPKMNGKEFATAVQRRLPKLPVIFMSGFSADLISKQGILDEGTTILDKPFNSRLLAQNVRRALDRSKP